MPGMDWRGLIFQRSRPDEAMKDRRHGRACLPPDGHVNPFPPSPLPPPTPR